MSGKKGTGSASAVAGESKRSSRSSSAALDEEDARSEGSGGSASEPFVRQLDAYDSWKQNLPILYDTFIHSNLEWPSYACAWGPVLPDRDANGQPPPFAAASAAAAAAASAATPAGPGTPTSSTAAAAAASAAAAAAAAATPHLTGAALTPRHYPTSYVTQNFYLSRSTDSKLERDKWIGSPNMLLKAEIYYPNQYRAQDISKMQNFDEDQRNPCLIIKKKLVHPGEINRIRVVPQYPDLIATHTDSPLVYVWNTHTQPTRRSQLNTDPSVPDLTLQGHVERADCNTLYYALDCSPHNPFIISGGSDQKICLWSIADYCSTLLTTAHVEAQAAAATAAGTHASGMQSVTVGAPRTPPSSAPLTPSKKHVTERLLTPRLIFHGHTAQVEEVCFHPRHQQLLCSVGDDKLLLVWDMRLGGSRPALRIETTHTDDVNAVHWNSVNDNLLLTGSSDHSVKLIDLRRIAHSDSFTRKYTDNPEGVRKQHAAAGDHGASAVVHTFRGHAGNVTNVQWHSNGEYFASGSDDGDLCVWSIRGIEELTQPIHSSTSNGRSGSPMDADSDGSPAAAVSSSSSSGLLPPKALWDGSSDGQPEHLLFRHSGHRTAVVNFSWNHFVKDGWTMASLSDDSADETLVGGGRLHVWRITDLLHKDYALTSAEFAAVAAQQAPSTAATTAAASTRAASPNGALAAPSSAPTPLSRPSSPSLSDAGGATSAAVPVAGGSSASSERSSASGEVTNGAAQASMDVGSAGTPTMEPPPPEADDDVAAMNMDD